MSGYVSRGASGTTELRVHGVSGTPPESMLTHPNVELVSGDRTAAFYRRWWPIRPQPPEEYDGDSNHFRQEAYSWGALTAGSRLRALWLLLLPFMFANIAFFMSPQTPANAQKRDRLWWFRKSGEAFQRVFAIGLTLVLVLTAVSVAMDMVAWQCTRPGPQCSDNVSWLGFLTDGFFAQPSRRLALAALVPLAAISMLWRLSRSTQSTYEATSPPPREPAVGSPEPAAAGAAPERSPLEQRKLWNGAEPVRQLASVHIAASVAATGVLLVAPIADGGAWSAALQLILAVLLALLVGSVLLVILPVTATRHDPGGSGRLASWQQKIYSTLLGVAVTLVLGAGIIALLPDVGPGTTAAVGGTRVLPWFGALFGWVVLGLAVGWLLIAALTIPLAWARRRELEDTADTRAGDLAVPPAWWGLGTPVVLMLGWLMAGGFSAGFSLLVADWLGEPVPAGRESDAAVALSLPAFYFWAAVGAGVMLLLIAIAAAAGIRRYRVRRRQAEERINQIYQRWLAANGPIPEPEAKRRAQKITRAWARASAAEIGRAVFGRLTIAISLILFGGVVLYLIPSTRNWVEDNVPGWLVGWCVVLIVFATGALIGLGRAAYKDRNKRRTLGMLWDVGTFWPRATHPLAPPSYGERVMPDLIRRIDVLTGDPGDAVILSGHSQGSIITATVFLQLDPAQQEQVCLLTYGCPLSRLYARFFPAYFGPRTLRRLGQLLDTGQPAASPRAGWAWRNLFRPSDPIGGPVFNAYPGAHFDSLHDLAGSDNGDVDRELMDPLFVASDRDTTAPAIFGHSNYWADPAFVTTRELVLTLHRARNGSTGGSDNADVLQPHS